MCSEKHKESLSVRVIHSCTNHLAEGFSAYINVVLKCVLLRFNHVCTSTRHLISILKDAIVTERSCFLKLDVKDFHMDGSHTDLCSCVEQAIQSHLDESLSLPGVKEGAQFEVKAFVSMLEFVLVEQFVQYNDTTYRVVCGSGMGAKHSPGVSSVPFLVLTELQFNLFYTFRSALQVYARVHDDILVVCPTPKQSSLVAEFLVSSLVPSLCIG